MGKVLKRAKELALTEAQRPAPIREWRNAHWLAVATVCIGAFMNQLDASIVTIAFPTLRHTFNAAFGSVAWVGLSYLVMVIGLVSAIGRVADMVGRKLLYFYGFILFIAASVVCAFAPNLIILVLARFVQGIGAAMLQANSVAIIATVLPRGRLARGIGIQGTAQALGLALGPTIGGALIALGGWRLIFLVNVPAGLLGAVAAWFLIPRTRELTGRVPFDFKGLGALFPSILLGLVVLTFGPAWSWFSPRIIIFTVAAIFLGFIFVGHEKRTKHPMMKPQLFRIGAFTEGLTSGFFSYTVLFGTLFAVPFLLQRGFLENARTAGSILTIMPIFLAVAAPIGGLLAERYGARIPTSMGMAFGSLALLLFAIRTAKLSSVEFELALLGAGLGLFTPANNAAIMGSVKRSESGIASGILNMTRSIGASVGIGATSMVMDEVVNGLKINKDLVTHGFTVASWMLFGCCAVALALSLFRKGEIVDLEAAKMSEG